MFANDGCKLPSNASKECSGNIKELEQKRDCSVCRQIGKCINMKNKEVKKRVRTFKSK